MNIDLNISRVVKLLESCKQFCCTLSSLSFENKEINNFGCNNLKIELKTQEESLKKTADLLEQMTRIVVLSQADFNEIPPIKLQLIQNKPHQKGVGYNIPDDWRYLSGIYILWHDNEIIYIGQSKNLHDRIVSHKAEYNRKKNTTFHATHVTIFRFAPIYLDSIEYFWINKYRPKYNKRIG